MQIQNENEFHPQYVTAMFFDNGFWKWSKHHFCINDSKHGILLNVKVMLNLINIDGNILLIPNSKNPIMFCMSRNRRGTSISFATAKQLFHFIQYKKHYR